MIGKRIGSFGALGVVAIVVIAAFIFYRAGGGHSLDISKPLTGPQVLAIGQTAILDGVTIKVNDISEDSRCPKGVACVWAGRIVSHITLSAEGATKTGPISVGDSIPFESHTVTLLDVKPEKVEGVQIQPGEYRLLFKIDKAEAAGVSLTERPYQNDEFGFSFKYPASYLLDEHEDTALRRTHLSLVLTKEKPGSNSNPAGEGPVSVSVDVYKDPIGSPTLLEWLDTPASNYNVKKTAYQETTLAGKNAVTYDWSGLYEGRTVAAANKDYIFAVTATYITSADPTLDVFDTVKKSVQFK